METREAAHMHVVAHVVHPAVGITHQEVEGLHEERLQVGKQRRDRIRRRRRRQRLRCQWSVLVVTRRSLGRPLLGVDCRRCVLLQNVMLLMRSTCLMLVTRSCGRCPVSTSMAKTEEGRGGSKAPPNRSAVCGSVQEAALRLLMVLRKLLCMCYDT